LPTVPTGSTRALGLAHARRGTQLDPSLVDAFSAEAADVLDGVDAIEDWSALIEHDPGLQQRLTDAELDTALEAIADFTDLRCRRAPVTLARSPSSPREPPGTRGCRTMT
jgi:hypothetical protein